MRLRAQTNVWALFIFERRIDMKERENKVLAMLMMENSVSGHSIEETLEISRSARVVFMHRLMKKHKEIQNISPHGVEA